MLQTTFTLDDMRRYAAEAWGQIGADIVNTWTRLNTAYFDGSLRPVPLILTQTQPYGRRIGFCSYPNGLTGCGRTITLNLPAHSGFLLADNNTLLHEMLHQYLFERGENSAHAGEPWRREIMRLTKLISGKTIWAGPSKIVRQDGKAVRMNAPHAETGEPSLPQKIIARWPDELGISLGFLGQCVPET